MSLYDKIKDFDENLRILGVIFEEVSKTNHILKEAMGTRTLVSILAEFEQSGRQNEPSGISAMNELLDAKHLYGGIYSLFSIFFKKSAKEKAQYIDDKITKATFFNLNSAFEFCKSQYALSSDLIEHARNLTERLPENAEAHYLFGKVLFFNGMLLENDDAIDASLESYRLAVTYGADSVDFYEDFTEILVFRKQYQDAENVLVSALKKNSSSSHFNRLMGIVLMETDRAEEALSYFKRSFEVNPRFETAVDLGLCYRKLGIEHLDKVKYYLSLGISKAEDKYGDELDKVPPQLLGHYYLAKELLQ